MKSTLYLLLITITITLTSRNVAAQGCVAVRAMGGNNPLSPSGYTLPKGEFQIGASYRYFHSWRHFVGTDEKKHRQTTQGGFDANKMNERGNAVNIYSHSIDIILSYAITDRLQVNVSIPYVHNERNQVLRIKNGGKRILDGEEVDSVLVGDRYSLYAQGLGDIRMNATYWILDPNAGHQGNLMIGVGTKLNTGSHTETGMVPLMKNGVRTEEEQTMDQAIQPGDGGIGVSLELQGFWNVHKNLYTFANAYYLFNPRESNGSFKSAPTVVKDENGNTLGTLTGYNEYACPDQYFARVGLMGAVDRAQNLTLSGALRMEGIPAYDAFGGQVAYRRPGYVVAVEPGVTYRYNKHSFNLLVPFNFVRDRIQSAADIARQNLENSVIESEDEKVHIQGDAAFADYSINFTYTYRPGKLFGKKKTDE
jgi:hypothetical protein